jgi:hypothetical protein
VAIRSLAPQLGRGAERRRALGEAGGEGDQRQLVDRQRHLGAADLGAAQRRGADGEAGGRLAAALAPRLDLDRRAHPLEHGQQAGPGRVDADLLEHDLAALDEQGGDGEEGGGGDVGGHGDLAGLDPLRGVHGDAALAALDPGAGRRQHPLAVVAGGQRLDDRGRALGEQPGEEQAGLDLGAGDRQLVLDAVQRRAPDLERRQPVLAAGERGAHLAQRHGDPVDRPAADRVVAVERPLSPVLPGEPTRQQTQQGAGVADVDRRRGRAAQADAADAQVRALSQPGPQVGRRLQRRHRVRGAEVARDPRLPLAHRRDQRRAVGDRLVGGRAQGAAQGSGRGEAGHRREPIRRRR